MFLLSLRDFGFFRTRQGLIFVAARLGEARYHAGSASGCHGGRLSRGEHRGMH